MYPISIDVRGRRVVVVGGGEVAERKVRALLDAGADVLLVAPQCTQLLQAFAQGNRLRHLARAFQDEDLAAALLIFVATGDDALNARITALARERGIWVNDAGDAARGTFVVPAVHRTGSLTFTVETGGASPALAARLRDELRERYDDRYRRAAAALRSMRDYASHIVSTEERAVALRAAAARPIDELAALNPQSAQHLLEELLPSARPEHAPRAYVCATRASRLALWQTRLVMAQLAKIGVASTVLELSTKGDIMQDRALNALGSDGIFVKELEHALRERRADYAVHSCKDLPSALPSDMLLAAVSAREDPRDAFCSEHYASLDALPTGSLVGTSSPRRRALLLALRPDLRCESIRGNVDTRLRKLVAGEYDAIILAMAGLTRLGLRATHTVALDIETMTPAAGQGALGIECRADDTRFAALLHDSIADVNAEIAVHAERAFLHYLRAGCQAPIGVHATHESGQLVLRAVIAARDGSQLIRGSRTLPEADIGTARALGEALAMELEARGGRELLDDTGEAPLHDTLFLLPRTQERSSRIAPALRSVGGEVIEALDASAAQAALAGRTPDVLLFPSSGCVGAIAPYLAELRARGQRPLVAVMGQASADAARASGFEPDITAGDHSIAAFVQSVTEYLIAQKVHR
ncbi:MAG TPA: hydroxymethylbilane synthase [Candidatus Baltobacteraceae bacterium]